MAEWRHIPEAGTVWGIRALVLLARTCGRRIAGWFLYLVALYYAIVRGTARRASRDYLQRVGHSATFASIVRHLHMFAQVSLDRLFFLTGRWDSFEFEQRNHDQLVEISRTGVAAISRGAGWVGDGRAAQQRSARPREARIPVQGTARCADDMAGIGKSKP